ncbi:hypothetical protein F66182_832 [Fusarium sp. NRRL 66182]|nr:hypothetical protein F66182_832 [Fusarium sp. NRRL 66182]
MEPVGLAVGVVGLAGLFSSCLEAVEKIDSYRHAGRESRFLDAQLKAEQYRFKYWGEAVGINNCTLSEKHHPALDDADVSSAVEDLLSSVREFCAALEDPMNTPAGSGEDPPSIKPPQSRLRGPMQSRWRKTVWTLHGKTKQTNNVQYFSSLVHTLYSVVSPDTAGFAEPKPVSRTNSLEQVNKTPSNGESYAAEIRAFLQKEEEHMRAETKRNLSEWLGSPSPNDVYNDSIDKRLETTCEWMLHRPEFAEWYRPSNGPNLLWINGPAGFGKTILCAKLAQEISSTSEEPVAHFFLSSKFVGRDDPFLAIRSWLATVTLQSSAALNVISKRYLLRDEQVATRASILPLFREVITAVPHCKFILDGLDECTGINGDLTGDTNSVTRFLKELGQMVADTTAKVLVVSRNELVIRHGLGLFSGFQEYAIQLQDVRPDILTYSTSIVNSKLPNKDESKRAGISLAMANRCQGQFQWLRMQGGLLRKGRNRKQLERDIDETPAGLHSLYDRDWDRINALRNEERERALSLLRWTAFSMRPLTVFEITEAVLVTGDCADFPVDELPDSIDEAYVESEILGLCGSLIEVRVPASDHKIDASVEIPGSADNPPVDVDASAEDLISDLQALSTCREDSRLSMTTGVKELHLTHFSVREYLLSKFYSRGTSLLVNQRAENMLIAKLCLCYINYSSAWHDQPSIERNQGQMLRDYAATSWYQHSHAAEPVDSELKDAMNSFFNRKGPTWNAWREYLERNAEEDAPSSKIPKGAGPLQYACYLRLKTIVSYLLHDCHTDPNEYSGLDCAALLIACREADEEVVRMLLDFGSEVNVLDGDEYTPLYWASDSSHVGVVKMLLDKGADLNMTSQSTSLTPLHQASYRGNVEILQLLLSKGADVNAPEIGGWTPLLIATDHGHHAAVKLLLDEGGNLAACNVSRWTSLHVAALRGYSDIVDLFLSQGADITTCTEKDWTPLHAALHNNHSQVAQMLIDKAADINACTQERWTPLHIASYSGYSDMVQLLLEKGADFDTCNTDGWTPLHLASFNGHLKPVQLLLGRGANLNALNPGKSTPLYLASSHGHTEVVKFLLRQGADIYLCTRKGWTSMRGEAHKGHFKLAQLLYEKAAETTTYAQYSWTPLYVAIDASCLEVVQLFLDSDADIEFRDTRGRTALMIAAMSENLDVLKLLLERDADEAAKDFGGRTALSYAAECGHLVLVRFLCIEGDSDPTEKDNLGRTALFHACQQGRNTIVDALLTVLTEKREVIDWRDHYGSSPLSIAARNGHLEAVKSLLATKVIAIGSGDQFGRTAIWWATNQGHVEVLRLLVQEEQQRDLGKSDVESLGTSASFSGEVLGWCDICCFSLLRTSGYYHCPTCNAGDFDICSDCFSLGGRCLDSSHELDLRQRA